ncbi:hypothetical protein [Aeromonas simiae]|uniref:hypothetical protein n=1 Tax=Aeromonas simiae TaxID=218936 RepID=UPI000B25411B|nr:hypothetical protein [Aeromonas simiae]
MSGLITTLCGGLLLIAARQHRQRLLALAALAMTLLPWLFDAKLQEIMHYALSRVA